MQRIFSLAVLGTLFFVTQGTGCASQNIAKDEKVTQNLKRVSPTERANLKAAKLKEQLAKAGVPSSGPLYFSFDEDSITEKSRTTLRAIANEMLINEDANLIIEGHTDDLGSSSYNLALGDRRSNIAFDYLMHLGVEDDRIHHVSLGEEAPAEYGTSTAARAKNRRDEFRFFVPGAKAAVLHPDVD
ncbi:MAG: OmpA family protein [Deltaproteobacteria bacterium]|nr:OmpA family protein [Deltaproteobacteria bacterium]